MSEQPRSGNLNNNAILVFIGVVLVAILVVLMTRLGNDRNEDPSDRPVPNQAEPTKSWTDAVETRCLRLNSRYQDLEAQFSSARTTEEQGRLAGEQDRILGEWNDLCGSNPDLWDYLGSLNARPMG